MGNQAFMGRPAKVLAVIVMATLPTSGFAGSYGSAGVSDATVGQTAAADTIWCERIEARVPRNLFARMECASSAVAGERITNRRTLRDFFTVRRNGPVKDPAENDDPDRRVTTNTPDDDPNTPTANQPTAKWDRLGDLGVTPQNINRQSPEFQQEFQDYFEENGGRGDWSGFNPSSPVAD